ncbi:zinc finger, CCHC-type, retrotransposon gag domain protein [Tanacetum coccineum]
MPYYISQTTENLKEILQKELEEFRKGGIMNDFRNEMATYHDFTTCDVPKFDGIFNLIASTRWLVVVEGAFRTSNYKEKNKVNFASNFLRDSAKIWWEEKVCEKGKEWIGPCTWKEFKELFNAEYTPAEEIDRIQEEFQTLTQTNKMVNEMWKKFNDLIHYCPEYHGNENLMAGLQRKKNKEAKETKIKLEFGDRDTKKPKHDHSRRRHKPNECPNPKAIEAKPLKSIKEEKMEKAEVPNPKARVYVMAVEEDKLVHDVVTDTLLVNSIPSRVLYDSGASVSFVSYKF